LVRSVLSCGLRILLGQAPGCFRGSMPPPCAFWWKHFLFSWSLALGFWPAGHQTQVLVVPDVPPPFFLWVIPNFYWAFGVTFPLLTPCPVDLSEIRLTVRVFPSCCLVQGVTNLFPPHFADGWWQVVPPFFFFILPTLEDRWVNIVFAGIASFCLVSSEVLKRPFSGYSAPELCPFLRSAFPLVLRTHNLVPFGSTPFSLVCRSFRETDVPGGCPCGTG